MPTRRLRDKVKGFATTIGAHTEFKGDFFGKDNCIVHGSIEGKCKVEGSLIIGADGKWHGDLEADNVVVAGEVTGSIAARGQIEILSSGKVTGILVCRHIAIAEGAIHRGEIRMSGDTTVTRFQERRSWEEAASQSSDD